MSNADYLQDELDRLGTDIFGALQGLMARGVRNERYDAKVVRTGDQILLPEGAHLPDIIDVLRRQHASDEQVIRIGVTLPVPPWDGAVALVDAIRKTLGPVTQRNCACGDPNCGARQMDVEIGLNQSIQIPWGSFHLPGMEDAHAQMDTAQEDGRLVFHVNVNCKRKYEARVRRLLDTVRENAQKNSLHKGKAFSVQFIDDLGDVIPLPTPKFFDLGTEKPIFNDELTASIARNILVPLMFTAELEAMGESLKQGILAAGIYGVGKTLLANYVARVATENGWTFIYVKNSDELEEALRFARLYEPAVVFCEDVDRIAGQNRTDEVNNLANQMDGVDGKTAKIMVIVTTNHPDKINPAMRRPGRIDLVLDIQPPDAKTAEQLLRSFAAESLEPGTDLSEAGQKLAGKIPACIRETVSRAKKEQLRRTSGTIGKITGQDLSKAADDVVNESNLFRNDTPDDVNSIETLGRGLTEAGAALTRSARTNGQALVGTH